jgi:hypothetical protein
VDVSISMSMSIGVGVGFGHVSKDPSKMRRIQRKGVSPDRTTVSLFLSCVRIKTNQ